MDTIYKIQVSICNKKLKESGWEFTGKKNLSSEQEEVLQMRYMC